MQARRLGGFGGLFEWQEHKIHIFEPTSNVLFTDMETKTQQKQKAGIVTSLNVTILTNCDMRQIHRSGPG